MSKKKRMSVNHEINALALLNILDIFSFTLTATDSEIVERYGTESNAIDVAEKYLDIALKSEILSYPLGGWSMNYSQPLKDSEERTEKTAYFYDKEESESKDEPQAKYKNRTIPSIDFDIDNTNPTFGVLPCHEKCDISGSVRAIIDFQDDVLRIVGKNGDDECYPLELISNFNLRRLEVQQWLSEKGENR